jgi:hypothetical protein
MRRGYRKDTGGTGDLDDALSDAAAWMRRAGLAGDARRAARISYPFVGEIVDGRRPGASDLHDRLLECGLLLVLGQAVGHGPEALLGEAVTVERDARIDVLGRELVCDRLAVANVRVGSRYSAGGRGDLSGLALEGFYLVNLDEIAPGPYVGERRPVIPPWRPSDPEDRLSLDWPGGVLVRLGAHLPEDGLEVRRAMIARHEEGHLLDAARYLPISAHLWEGLRLVAGAGFSPERIQGRLEGDAQLVSLATAPQPRAALFTLVATGHRRDASPPHSRGYHEVLREMVEIIAERPDDFREIDPEANVLQQLDRLTEEQLRDLARILLARRGLP